MNKVFKSILAIGLAVSLLGCGDDDKKDNKNTQSSPLIEALCKRQVQCHGSQGHLDGYTPAEITQLINDCIDSEEAAVSKIKYDCTKEADEYRTCLMNVGCSSLIVFTDSKGQTIPDACRASNQTLGDCINGKTTPKPSECGEEDMECLCRKNPNMDGCKTNPTPTECGEEDMECWCRKNPNMDGCKTDPTPTECGEEDKDCWCEKHPESSICKPDTPQPTVDDYNKQIESLNASFCSTHVGEDKVCGTKQYYEYGDCIARLDSRWEDANLCSGDAYLKCLEGIVNIIKCEIDTPCSTFEENDQALDECMGVDDRGLPNYDRFEECNDRYPSPCDAQSLAFIHNCSCY